MSPELVLRRDCSPDYSDADIGDPVLEVILQPGVSAASQHKIVKMNKGRHLVSS